MVKVRLSTTVDRDLLAAARDLHVGETDASMVEAALTALLTQHRRAAVDATFEAYDRVPIDTPDAWGDLASFGEAAGAS